MTSRKAPAVPILCNYYLTYRCNAYCDFCHFGDHELFKNSRHADTERVLANLDALKKLGVKFIDFTGGEPLLHRDVAKIVEKASRLGMKTSITTNGLLYPKYAEALRGNVDLLHFSLDSADKHEHDTLRGVPCYDAVMESIRIAKGLGEHPDLLFTVTNENYMQLPAVQEIAVENNLLLLLNPIFSYFREEGLSLEVLDYIEAFAKQPHVYLNPSFVTLRRMGGNDPEDPLCKAVSRVIVISPEDEILLPCYHLHNEKVAIDGDLLQAAQSPRVQWHAEQEGRHSFCKGCTINCYFEPSFAFPTNKLSIATVPSKIKYGYHKYVKQSFGK